MPEKKKTTKKKTATNSKSNNAKNVKKGAKSNTTSKAKKSVKDDVKEVKEVGEVRRRKKRNPDSVTNQIIPYVFGLLAFSVAFCLIVPAKAGSVGRLVQAVLCSLFGWGAVIVPILLLIQAFTWRKDIEADSLGLKWISVLFSTVSLSVIIHVLTATEELMSLNVVTLWTSGGAWSGGGLVGGFIAALFVKGIDKILTLCIFIPTFLIFDIFLFGLTPHAFLGLVKEKLRERRERRYEEYEEYEENEDDEKVWHSIREKEKLKIDETVYEEEVQESPVDMAVYDAAMRDKKKKKSKVDVDLEDEPPFDPDVPLDELAESVKNAGNVLTATAATDKDRIDLEEIFKDTDNLETDVPEIVDDGSVPDVKELELMVERKQIKEELPKEPVKEVSKVKEYVFPPLSLLNQETNVKNEDVSEEMRSTALKLVETLRSFKVRTRIIDVSRGPSITRYELAPEEGVRVRTIANLVDDIALNLATTGVRIEAPIPGKAAVGIEVPNKNVSIVYLKELLDTQQFKQAKSRVTVALGMDVAGTPIFLDIAKMPHLLIAGATGMGKSVCINSMIVSLLYKATPDEVKLILIDPKKVELSIYNGLPHLLVPVVTDPKKAAGSLHWAVTEMDRRFELIEEVGVRDVASYNRITKDDPEKEFLPQIVIVIDELADLMMTAPDDVEESVCRLMQKARAAGMHVIIGTQRPSVDVITGLIKANIPSRIAFTVASQVDSRTIIDRAGAESLIGRGDMLYMPVGASKPIRVQGAFVSEEDVEEIVTFIKKANCDSEVKYADDVMEQIEKEAAKCGMGTKKAGGTGAAAEASGDDDPMLRDALELAVNSGKISTSLIQRRLSLGYGRAAKLIDRMEQLGYVSAPDGQKPREVLISKEQFMEMVLKNDENIVT